MTSKQKKNKKRKKKTNKQTNKGKRQNKNLLNTHCIRMMYSGYRAPLIQRTDEVLGL